MLKAFGDETILRRQRAIWSRGGALFTLVLIVGLHVSASIFWISYDQRPPIGQDSVKHALDGLWVVTRYDPLTIGLVDTIEPHLRGYPPAHRLLLGGLYRLFQPRDRVAKLASTGLFGLLLLATYGIGRALSPDNREAALLSTFLVGCFPAVFASARSTNLSMMLTLAVAVSLLCLARCDRFESTKWSVLFGASLGFGLLVKWSFAFFLVGPVVLSVAQAVKGKPATKRFIDAAFALLIAASVSLPWYLHNLPHILTLAKHIADVYRGHYGITLFSLRNLGLYPVSLVHGVTLPLAVICVWGLGRLIHRKRVNSLLLTISSVIVACCVLTFVFPKSPRFIVPAYPVVALVGGLALEGMPHSRTRRVYASLAVLMGLLMLAQGLVPVDMYASALSSSFFEEGIIPLYPEPEGWSLGRILDVISKDWDSPLRLCNVAVLPKLPELTALWCNYESLLARRTMLFHSLRADGFFWSLLESDYLVTGAGQVPRMTWVAERDPFVSVLIDRQTKELSEWLANPPDYFVKHYRQVETITGDGADPITIMRQVRAFNYAEKIALLEVLKPMMRDPDQKDLALRFIYRTHEWQNQSQDPRVLLEKSQRLEASMNIWRDLEDRGVNRSWLPVQSTESLVDVVEAEDMIHNLGGMITSGRRVHGGWEILEPSGMSAPVLLPGGKAGITVVAKAVFPDDDCPIVSVWLGNGPTHVFAVSSRDPMEHSFEARTEEGVTTLTLAMLGEKTRTRHYQRSVIFDKVIIKGQSPSGASELPSASSPP